MHISFLLHNAYGIGGTIRTTFTLAGTLAEQHDVEIVSVFRHRDDPKLGAPAGVRMSHLLDLRKSSPGYDGAAADHARPASVFPRGDSRHRQYSRLTDSRIEACLGALEADVVVGTRPGLNVHISRQARRGPVRVGQEHLTLESHGYRLRREISHRYGLLDAVTTVTEADARDYRARLRLPGVRIEAIPNSVPEPAGPPADGDAKWIVAAGRLHRVKRYDVLIRAFARIAAVRPEWRLRIYGAGDASGNEQQALRALVDELGLRERVLLMGSVAPMEAEWPKHSIAAVTSERESFGMTIVEAMRCGVPVVATDCPHGPAEIIDDGTDGRLVPLGDTGAFAKALLGLIDDDALRHRMGRAALASAARFDPAPIAERHEKLFTELAARSAGKGSRGVLRTAFHRSRGGVLDGAYAVRDKAAGVIRRGRA
ncbi:glycosyltransferase family 4 protein [Streptomyces sp. HB132]|uniref:glycosyltransferase family 4 protein n=1 Tax=Streptomyces sp. HB132 TaxID=767388 RepID=UPI001961AF14|nr:glycosyltransferase family 4 protein [Streptomyces sp. HB132]MBM7442090.1 glycosyltransferase involved in cell wall biosynthesis [Streptomyces sp. HB132]